METTRIVFSGSGGQGVITAAIVLAEAAALHQGLNAVQTQSYGPEARGGATRADVVLSQEPIRYPKVIHPNLLVALTQEAYNKFAAIIRPGGLLLVDSRFVRTAGRVDARQVSLPMYERVLKEIEKPVVFNICMLGALLRLSGILAPDAILETLRGRVPAEFLKMNQQALELGMRLADETTANV
jgi:2-oxoglutarate ferredoxin oxidoreductase subunit gamma